MKCKIKLNLEWDIEIDDNDIPDYDTFAECAKAKLADTIMDSNETVENIFFEGMEVSHD